MSIGATNVRSGKVKVFQGAEIGPNVLLASACLPTLFRAVEIDGEAYWDGGYTGNPPLFPLLEKDYPDDILIININPLERDEVSRTPQEIQNRINEIGFNTSLLCELRAISFVQSLISEGTIELGAMKRVNVHIIVDDALMNDSQSPRKQSRSRRFWRRLKAQGKRPLIVFSTRIAPMLAIAVVSICKLCLARRYASGWLGSLGFG